MFPRVGCMPEPQDRSASRVISGSVSLVSVTPNAEKTILYCARVSSNQENESPGLIRYLIDHKHWSPFELAHATIEFNTSRAIGREILRHRSSSFQEFSQRYASPDGFIVYPGRKQAEKNRQSSTDDLDPEIAARWEKAQDRLFKDIREIYEWAIEHGIARECARMILPEATKTKIYMSGTIRSWIHFFEQRCAPEAQKEIRDLAEEARWLLSAELPVIANALGWPEHCV